jgi:hypothetical protein
VYLPNSPRSAAFGTLVVPSPAQHYALVESHCCIQPQGVPVHLKGTSELDFRPSVWCVPVCVSLHVLVACRFGESGLHACEVLLKDMADSKRLDANIR